MKSATLALLGLFTLLGSALAQTDVPTPQYLVVRDGRYTFEIDVRNESHRSIYDARAWARVSGRQARIQTEAQGYREESGYVSLRDGQYNYRFRVTLRDPSMDYDVRDRRGRYVASYAREDNYSSFANEFRYETRIQEAGYDFFGPEDVDVRINGMIAFGERIEVLGQGSSRRVVVTLRRRDMNNFRNRVSMEIPSDEDLRKGRAGEASRRYARRQSFEALHAEPVLD
jgi:hypothetical protein